MSIEDHVRAVHTTLKAMEAAQKRLAVTTKAHHAALQNMLEDCGTNCGLTPGQVTTYGGGTPKSS